MDNNILLKFFTICLFPLSTIIRHYFILLIDNFNLNKYLIGKLIYLNNLKYISIFIICIFIYLLHHICFT